jgi:predicted permease
MESFVIVIQNSLPIFATIAITLFLKYRGVLTEETRKGLRPILFKFILPFFIFRVLYNQTFTRDDIVMILILIGFMLLMFSCYFFYLTRTKWEANIKAALLITLFGFSVGSFAYPFVQLNFSQEVFGKVVVFDTTLFVLIMIMGPIIGSFSASEERASIRTIIKTIFSDVVFLSLLLALTVNVLNISIPVSITSSLEFISRSFTFIILVFVGLSLSIPDMKGVRRILQTFIWRHAFIIAFLTVLVTLIPVEVTVKQALVLALFTPFSSFGLNYAEQYNVDGATIAQLSIFSMAFYILMYPVVVAFALSI